MANPTATVPLCPDTSPALQILYRDEHLLAIHKPAGLLVHRTALDAHEHDTVMARLAQQLGSAAPPGLALAHRLDKGSSGLLLLACHAEAARHLAASFEQGRVHKRYLALVRGWPQAQLECTHPLARDPELPSTGQPQLPALTRFTRLGRVEWPFAADPRFTSSRYALVEAQPEQGRRHQIRRHLKHLGHPIVGDATHGKGAHNRAVAAWLGQARLWLHGLEMQLTHPASGQPLMLRAEPGAQWQAWMQAPYWQPD